MIGKCIFLHFSAVCKQARYYETERDYALFVLLFLKNMVLKNPTCMVFYYSTQKFLTIKCDNILKKTNCV